MICVEIKTINHVALILLLKYFNFLINAPSRMFAQLFPSRHFPVIFQKRKEIFLSQELIFSDTWSESNTTTWWKSTWHGFLSRAKHRLKYFEMRWREQNTVFGNEGKINHHLNKYCSKHFLFIHGELKSAQRNERGYEFLRNQFSLLYYSEHFLHHSFLRTMHNDVWKFYHLKHQH